ncbi:MAG TPA: hypothetical protein VFI17_08700 [Solirubrobacterales bacterium]|nr:hypothetical protein [Solirubrobacterales bacterium]
MKHLRTLGLTAMAVLALTAIVDVSSASAKNFHSTNAGKIVSEIKNTHTFGLTGSTVNCNTIAFNGNANTNSETMVVHPEYSNCKAFGFLNTTVNTAGCNYRFNANLNTFDLEGCTGGGINFGSSGCSVFYPNQTGINGVTYTNTNTAPNRTLDIKTASTNLKFNVTSANMFGCPLTEGGKHNNATYNGDTGVMVEGSAETWIE